MARKNNERLKTGLHILNFDELWDEDKEEVKGNQADEPNRSGSAEDLTDVPLNIQDH